MKIYHFKTDFCCLSATICDKNWGALKIFYSNMIRITCVAHGVNPVAEKVGDTFPDKNKLVNNGKKKKKCF